MVATCQAWESTAFLPALLAGAGLTVEALSPGLMGRSSFVSQHMHCSRRPLEAARQLTRLLARRRYDWVIVADEDLLTAVADTMKPDEHRSWFPARGECSAVLSKYSFLEHMLELGVSVPASRFFQTAGEAVEWMLELQAPLVVKGDRGFGGRAVRVADDVAALRAAVFALTSASGRVLVQQFIAGDNVSASVLYVHGKPLAWKASRTSCCYPDARSASTLHESIAHPDLEVIVGAVGAATGFHGFAGLDFIVDSQSRELVLLEFNPRPTLGLAGARINRRFFEPAVRAFVRGAPDTEVGVYAGAATQAYFPSYLFYALRHPRVSRLSHLRLCLSELRLREWRLWSWLVARTTKNELGRAVARLRRDLGWHSVRPAAANRRSNA
ncbi:MAG: ATP-grasp domain-containing protein [Candidatus Baltobacteraceae bacterium]